MKLIGIKIQDLPTDTVAQTIEHHRGKPRACVRILASVRFLVSSVAFFLSLLPWQNVGRSNLDSALQNLTMLILKTTDKNKELLSIYIYISNQKIYGDTYMYIYIERDGVKEFHGLTYV